MKYIDGKLFKEMLLSGMNSLGNNQARIDALNVFPVPDGDTGTNMYLTFQAESTMRLPLILIQSVSLPRHYPEDF